VDRSGTTTAASNPESVRTAVASRELVGGRSRTSVAMVPTALNIKAIRSAVVLVSFLAGQAPLAAQSTLRLSDPLRTVGVLDGTGPDVFGNLERVRLERAADALVVLDRLSRRVAVFDLNGQSLAVHEASGQGPGEFMYPVALDLDWPNFHVFDPGLSRISTFEVSADSIRLKGDFRLPLDTGWDMCSVGGRFFVLRWNQDLGGLLHRFGPEGRLEYSFGEPIQDDGGVLAGRTDYGRLLCGGSPERVFVSPQATPLVRAYSVDGQLIWETQVPGMVGPTISASEGRVRFRAPEGTDATDAAVTMAMLEGGRVLVQYGQTFAGMDQRGGNISDVSSVVLDPADGRVLALRDDLPRLDVVADDIAVSAQIAPFPQLVIYSLTITR